MCDRAWESMNEQDFDTVLESSVSDFPPEDIVAEVTPWKKAMRRICIGITLGAVTLSFWCLDHILPAIGMVLSLLGFRTLRRENKWFRGCFILTVIRAAYFFPKLILNTTIIQSSASTSPIVSALTIINLLLPLAEFFCLWQGLRTVQRKVDLPPKANGAAALIIWYALICMLAVVQYDGIIIPVAMIIGYFFILRNIYTLSKELDEAGYSVQPVPIRITDKCIVLTIVFVLLVGCTCGYLFGGSYTMAWSAVDASEHAEVEDIKEHLLELGFPEYVLNDLTAEDIKACDSALRVVVDVYDAPVNNGRTVTDVYGNNGQYVVQSTVYDVRELRITSIAVQVPDERDEWIIFHHFLWTTNPGFYGTESIQLWPAYKNTSDGWISIGEWSGRVLYDQDGITLSAPYHSLETQTYTASSMFSGKETNTDVFATFSLPTKGENQRGYVVYPIAAVQEYYFIDSWINYTHQKSWLQYPAVTAKEKRMTTLWNDAWPFRTIQEALQFNPAEEDVESTNP